ncbi:dTDP-4-dehydrorhamnose 3,5-epimerase family protein [Aestuariibius sp. 2305UL40-4]|uniref:dTDP-4-dehydrorhamnose 3,5-epimerase family protein n=1 Tax=Aestuariibius violaceus TaxID=3234132 RepID=UPI00345E52C4
MDLKLDNFKPDEPWIPEKTDTAAHDGQLIDGVTITPIKVYGDHRGELVELLTLRDAHPDEEPIVHVYRVTAVPGSIRGWVYHERQADRLAYTQGHFRIVLYDIRKGSPTEGMINVLELGEDNPARLRIPAFVVHAVQNRGETASFVNLPTSIYDPAMPDKCRLKYPDPSVPYEFD